MARCQHCGEPVAAGQETCYACGQKARTRAYRAERRVNPIVIIAAGLAVVAVLVSLWLMRANASRKQAALLVEEEAGRAQDSVRLAGRRWADALKAAEKDTASLAIKRDLDLVESRFQSVRTRVAASPNPQQESIIGRVDAELALLRHSAVVLASLAGTEKQTLRDSIQAGRRRVEDLTRELGNTE